MRMKAGKSYRCRNGEVIGPMVKDVHIPVLICPQIFYWYGNDSHEMDSKVTPEENPWDVVEELP